MINLRFDDFLGILQLLLEPEKRCSCDPKIFCRLLPPFIGTQPLVTEAFQQRFGSVRGRPTERRFEAGRVQHIVPAKYRPIPPDHEWIDRRQIPQGHLDGERPFLFVLCERDQTVRVPGENPAPTDPLNGFFGQRVPFGEMSSQDHRRARRDRQALDGVR